MINFKGPLLVVKYEDIQADSVAQVIRILDFVKYDYDEEFVRKALSQDFRFVAVKTKLCSDLTENGSLCKRSKIITVSLND